MKAQAFKTLVFVHRYVGIAIGWLMLMWCITGVVMMYVRYPDLRDAERVAHLPPIAASCCARGIAQEVSDWPVITQLRIERVGDAVLLTVDSAFDSARYDLLQARRHDQLSTAQAVAAAQAFAQTDQQATAPPEVLGLVTRDQWTVYPRFAALQPFVHVALHDAAGTEVYVSQSTATVAQVTTHWQRVWNWLGTVPHWLYFTQIRQNATLWNNLVTYSSLLGCFLTVFGLCLGVWQLRRRAQGWQSPYRGWKYWHHVPGLVAGLLVLSWVFSGLMSMQPWGFLESPEDDSLQIELQGDLPSGARVMMSLQRLPAELWQEAKQIKLVMLASTPAWLITRIDGQVQRVNFQGEITPLTLAEVMHAVQAIDARAKVHYLTEGDDYYYSHNEDRVRLPVWRVQLSDAQATRLYLDAASGALIKRVDAPARGFRWLHLALHRLDFTSLWRARPLWDGVMLVLLTGVMMVCVTGVVLGVRRLRR